MLHLQTTHLIVKEAILSRFQSDKEDAIDVRVADFDDTTYHVSVDLESKDVMKVSAAIRNFTAINRTYSSAIQEVYGSLIDSEVETGFDITLKIDLNSLPSSAEEQDALATKCAQIKRNVVGAPLITMAQALTKNAPLTEPYYSEFRMGEGVYFLPRQDRITVIYDVAFKDPTDKAIARIFLQEFNEVKRLRELASAPVPSFKPDAPQELTTGDSKLSANIPNNSDRIGFLSFGLQPRHLSPERVNNTVDYIVQFRAYLHYHITCSKSHMHTRMRKRVEMLLQVLNRAIPEEPKEKKTMSGRTFKVAGGGSAGL